MTFFYLTDFNQGPTNGNDHPDKEYQSQKEYITGVFDDLIKNIKRKAAYIIDADMEIGKA